MQLLAELLRVVIDKDIDAFSLQNFSRDNSAKRRGYTFKGDKSQ
jgi:hypothetical protein